MCRQECQMIIRLRSLKNQGSYIHKSFSTEHTENHIITSTHRSKFSCQVPGCDLVVRVRAIVHVQLFRRAVPPSPHITGESLLFQLWPFAVVCCSCSCTFSIDCSENASAELGGNARYQAHPAPRPGPLITSHGAVSLFQFTVC